MSKSTPGLDTEVAVIGGGPAGLTAGILLAQLGVDAQIFERRPSTSRLPRAHLLNQRTMEIFTRMGVAEDVYAMSPPEDRWHRVGWYTSLAGPRNGHGREIGHQQAWGGGSDRERYAAASPARYANVPQMRLDPLLRSHAELKAQASFNHDVVGIRQHRDHVELDVEDRATGFVSQVRARYAVGADGGRLCTDLLGVEMEGPTRLLDMVTMHVSADLSAYVTDDEVLLYYFIDPRGAGGFRGAICAMGPEHWGRNSEEWAFHQAFAWGDPAAQDSELLRDRMRDVLGIPDLEFEVHATSHWQFEGVTARQFRKGDVFLVGNAAHRHPPTGGLGLNAAVQDSHNLAWKLALVLQGKAGDGLLDSYQDERRPVDEFNVNHSLSNAGGHRRIAAALGQSADQAEGEGWAAIDAWLAPGPDGDARRAAVAEAVAGNADDYGQLNVELGFAYAAGAVVPDGSPAPDFDLRDYVPSTRPGHHLPHAWLETPVGRRSTLDCVPAGGFAIFAAPEGGHAWSDAATAAAEAHGVAIAVVVVGEDEALDVDGTWVAVRGVGESGAVLVRPDWHVAWRTQALPDDPAAALSAALRQILDTQEQTT